jgi:hypothetical protein
MRLHPVATYVSLMLVVVLLGPLLPPVFLRCCIAARREHKKWCELSRKHREMMFLRMHLLSMPQAAQDHIKRHQAVLRELGFESEGTYLLKPDPLPIYSEVFLSPEGESVAEVALIDDATSVSFTSVLENGHVLEWACSQVTMPTDKINASGRYTAHMVEQKSSLVNVPDLYRDHRETLARLEERFGCRALCVGIDQVKAVENYGNQVFGEVLFALGELDDPPRSPPLPNGRPQPVQPGPYACMVQTTSDWRADKRHSY